jgi:hypothetical protein
MKAEQRSQEEWLYRFRIKAMTGQAIEYSVAEELFFDILRWVEVRCLQIGGGFREEQEEASPEPKPAEIWKYSFCLEAADEPTVSCTTAEKLYRYIQRSAEDRYLEVSGGFRAPTEEEKQPISFLEMVERREWDYD